MVLSVGSSLSRSAPAAFVHRLKITLRSVKPPVWRRIEVRSDVALDEFSGLLEAAMGWWGYHLHSFSVGGAVYERPDPDDWLRRETHDESGHRLGDALGEVAAKMCWDYDFGRLATRHRGRGHRRRRPDESQRRLRSSGDVLEVV